MLATKDLVVGYDRPLFYCPDVEVRRGDRVALIGPNGAGKTTCSRRSSARCRRWTAGCASAPAWRWATWRRRRPGWTPTRRCSTRSWTCRTCRISQARNFLGQFLFSGDDVFRTIGTLSGGQRSRVALARLTLQGANFLLLDEPTNHLDLDTQEILEQVLRQFPGTILLVTHDRYLVQALATHIWRVAGDELRAYKGNYEEYLRQRAAEAEAKAEAEGRG